MHRVHPKAWQTRLFTIAFLAFVRFPSRASQFRRTASETEPASPKQKYSRRRCADKTGAASDAGSTLLQLSFDSSVGLEHKARYGTEGGGSLSLRTAGVHVGIASWGPLVGDCYSRLRKAGHIHISMKRFLCLPYPLLGCAWLIESIGRYFFSRFCSRACSKQEVSHYQPRSEPVRGDSEQCATLV